MHFAKKLCLNLLIFSPLSGMKTADVSQNVTQYIQKNLAEFGVSNASKFSVVLEEGTYVNMSVNSARTKFRITKGAHDEIEQGIQRNGDSNKYRLIIAHEARHLINQDDLKRAVSVGSSLWIVPTLLEKAKFYRNLNSSFAKFSLTASLVALGPLLYSRHQEWEADKFACTQAISKQELLNHKKHFEAFFGPDRQAFLKEYPITTRIFFNVFDPFHPYIGDRITYIEKQIQNFDQKQNS